jgi:hypothetical protein
MVKQREFSRANNVHFAGAARVLLCRVAHLSDQGAHHVFLESYVFQENPPKKTSPSCVHTWRRPPLLNAPHTLT